MSVSQNIFDTIALLKENGHISTGGYSKLRSCYTDVAAMEFENRELKELVNWISHCKDYPCDTCPAYLLPKETNDTYCLARIRAERMGIDIC